MTRRMPGVDVVLVGFGWTGAIMAEKLTAAGLKVLALERGPWRDTPTDFPTTFAPGRTALLLAARHVSGNVARNGDVSQQ